MPLNRLLRFRVPLGFLFAAWYLVLAKSVNPGPLVACAAIVAIGGLLRAWAAGYLLKGKRVAVGGPYAYIRNPLYVGSFLIGAGFCGALCRSPLPAQVVIFWVIYVTGFVLMYVAKGRAEEAELSRALGPEYDIYRSKVPAFFPVRGHVSGLGVQHYSRELYRRNREYQCLWGSLAVLAFLWWRFQHGM